MGGSISQTICTFSPPSKPERELIVRGQITTPANKMTCPKCGKFKKSGRASCCAPGGAWFKNCGAAGNNKVAYKWTDGANACKPAKPAAATTAASNTCAVCGSVKKSRKKSCCGRGGSWFRNCGSAGNKKFGHTWFEGIQVCKQWASSKRSAAAAYQIMNAAEKYLFNFANNTAKPSHTNTPAEPTTTTPATTKVVTTAAAPITTTTTTRIATFAAKKTPLPTTEWIENDEFYEGFGVSGSVSFVMSHLCAMFSIFVIFLE